MLLVPPAWRPLELCSQCFFPIDGQPSRFDRRQDESSDLVRRETVDTLRAFELHRKRIAEKQGVIGVERHRNTSIEVLRWIQPAAGRTFVLRLDCQDAR